MKSKQDQKEILVKYSAPTKLCTFPYGQIWKHLLDNDQYALYIQISTDLEAPQWVKMGEFLEKVYGDLVLDHAFIDNCLKLLKKGNNE